MKVGLVLEGGAMRGLYTAAILDSFMENNIKVDTLIGVSAGALFGVNYKSKQKGRVLRYNKKYANDKNYMGFHSLVKTGNIMNKEFCFDKLIKELDPFDNDTYNNSNEEFYAVVTNVETGKAEYKKLDDIESEENLEYLRASGSMPFVSKFVEVNGNKYLDGALGDSIPIDKMMELGVDKIIVILTRPLNYRKKKNNSLIAKVFYRKYPNLVSAINNRYKMYNETLDKIKKLESEEKIFVYRPSRFVNIKRVEKDTNKLQEMYDLGLEDFKSNMEKLNQFLEK